MDRREKKDARRRAKQLQRKTESREEQQVETGMGEDAVQETGAWMGMLGRLGGLLVAQRQASAAPSWGLHRLEEKVAKLKQEPAKRERNRATQSALRRSSHTAEFIALGGNEQRMALDFSFYTASDFCNFYGDDYIIHGRCFMVLGEWQWS